MPENLDRCVQDLISQGKSEDSAWAICRASLGEGEYPEDATDKDKAIALATLGESGKGFNLLDSLKKLLPTKKDNLAGLKEAANLGNWLEARIHSVFTSIADDMFGEGFMTREERISFSSAIGEALTAFNNSVQENIPQVYQRRPFSDPDDDMPMMEAALVEAGEGLAGSLIEAALRRDNTIGVKIIEPGWGSSGFYPADVLERDGPKVFTRGTQMFWNHQTSMEEMERPEGDLNDLAAELVSDARWEANNPNGPGLYADAQVFGPYQESVNELAGHIGVSIRAEGMATQGQMEGRKGPIIQQINNAKSVDFVTRAGAGGEILELFEAARQKAHEQRGGIVTTQENAKLIERLNQLEARDKERDQENARLREQLILRDAREAVAQQLQEAQLPDMVRNRLGQSLAINPPTTEAGGLDTEALSTKVKEAVDAELQYLQSVMGNASPVRGMGGNTEYKPEDVTASLEESFKVLTGSESAAKIAATGR